MHAGAFSQGAVFGGERVLPFLYYSAVAALAGDGHPGEPFGKGHRGAGGNFRRGRAHGMAEKPYQPLTC